MEERVISEKRRISMKVFEQSLSPQLLKQYIGQEKVKDNLRIFIEAAKRREAKV